MFHPVDLWPTARDALKRLPAAYRAVYRPPQILIRRTEAHSQRSDLGILKALIVPDQRV